MNNKQKVIVFVLGILCAVFCIVILKENEAVAVQSSNDSFICNIQSGFYSEAINVEFSGERVEEVYYTLDGSNPAKDNASALLFNREEGIYLPCEEDEKIYNLKAVAYYEDGTISAGINRTFILGYNVDERYDLLVLSVSGDPHDFYNYEDGIMVHGKLDDQYIADHPEWAESFKHNSIPVFGNFYQTGRESEKPVYVTLFDETGDVILAQNAGFRLYGAVSRMKNQPSFRLYARSEYDEQNEFDYVFFGDQYSEVENTLVDKFKRIIVRNSGNDNGYGFIRSELTSRLAIDFGFPDAQSSTPVCVYLNGEYYGVHWFVTNFDDEYFKQTYGEYTGEMYIMEGTVDNLTIPEGEEDENYIHLIEEYNEKQRFFATCDLNEEDNWKALNQFIDVGNFLQYSSIQHYTGNYDSLYNNYRIYRYYIEDGAYVPGSVFDGRYRFLLFDLDWSLGLEQIYSYYEGEKKLLTEERVHSEEADYALFKNLMTREDCKQTYIRYYLSCMNYYYSEAYVEPILSEMHASRLKELQYVYNNTDLLLNNFYGSLEGGVENIDAEMNRIRRFLNKRPNYGFYDLSEAFGGLTPYALNLQNDSGATVQIDYADVTLQELSGIYLMEVPPVLKAQPRVGQQFSHWLVNGEEVYTEELIIEESMVQDYVVNVACICEPDEEVGLMISAVKPKGGEDYIELTNFGQESVQLNEYYLSDSDGERKSQLPAITLASQESIIIYCKNYTGLEALGKPCVNFNISAGETVVLYNLEGNGGSEVTVPELGHEDGVYTMDMQTGEFWEIIP